jgi:hypothetical protein
MDLDDLDNILLLVAYNRLQGVQRMRTRQSGHEYIKELLDSAHPEHVRRGAIKIER